MSDNTMLKTASTPGVGFQFQQFLHWLLRPHPSLTDIEVRRQSSLLAGIILAILGTSLVGLVVVLVANGNRASIPTSVIFLVPGQVLITALYFLNRNGRYQTAAGLTVLLQFVLMHLAAVASNEITWLFFVPTAVILSAIFLSFRVTVLFFLFSIGVQIGLLILHPMRVPVSNTGPLVVFLMTASLILIYINHRVGLERERQTELRAANDALRASEAILEKRVVERTLALETARHEADLARQEAEHANQVKSQFLANMSHELRTPLNSILNFTAFVADGILGPVNDEQVEALHQSIASGKHLLALINDVLDITKIEAGLMDIFVQSVDLNEALAVVVSMAKGLTKNKPITLITQIAPDLPVTFGDKRRLRQVFLNIVSNAIKFTREGSVTIRANATGQAIRFEVEDTGIGIAPIDQSLVFASFKQAKHDLLDTPGTGLGMPISKYFVEAHGGSIWFESVVDKGTTFFVDLPIHTEAEASQLTSALVLSPGSVLAQA